MCAFRQPKDWTALAARLPTPQIVACTAAQQLGGKATKEPCRKAPAASSSMSLFWRGGSHSEAAAAAWSIRANASPFWKSTRLSPSAVMPAEVQRQAWLLR